MSITLETQRTSPSRWLESPLYLARQFDQDEIVFAAFINDAQVTILSGILIGKYIAGPIDMSPRWGGDHKNR